MKKWKGSLGAKVGFWIGITISGVIFLGSIVGAMAIQEAGIYDETEEEYRTKVYQSVARHYAVRALDNMKSPAENKWIDTNFRYGIIKADKIYDLDFNDESIYVERNFTEKVTMDDLYAVSYEIGENTQFSYSDSLFGGYNISDSAEAQLINDTVYRIVYNVEDGIFYYETSSGFYPVRMVELEYFITEESMMRCILSYDFDKKQYRSKVTVTTTVATETVVDAAESIEEVPAAAVEDTFAESSDIGRAALILQQNYLSLNMLDNTDFNYVQWDNLLLDGEPHYNDGNDIWYVDDAYVSSITQERDYWLEGDILCINHTGEEETTETYWVVAILPESVGFGWNRDLFVQANALVTLGYGLRYSIYVILFLSLGLCIFFLVLLTAAAGHRKGEEKIAAVWLDKIPFDLYLAMAALAEGFLMMVSLQVYRGNSVPGYVLLVFLVLCMCWGALLTLLTFAVRVKIGKWWQNTIIWHIFRWIVSIFCMIRENVSLLWKAALAMGFLAFLEFLGICNLYAGKLLLLWFLEKIVLALLVFAVIVQMKRLQEGSERIAEGDLSHQIDTGKMFWEFKRHGENLNSISTGMSKAVDERMKSERFKTELITNVSHDIKTPLTSIINYVDLLEKQELQNETAEEYLEVLERQSGRLKKLIEDLMEASKASTGNLAVNLERLEAGVSMVQTVGEFEEKTKASGLELLIGKPEEPAYIMADSRHFWRVIDNLMNNICKYAQPGTRVYIDLEKKEGSVHITFRNTSRYPLNISSEELMERFVRGDSSRNTEGSGLGLSIAKSLMELMGGTFELYVDGDLFKVVLGFPAVSEK